MDDSQYRKKRLKREYGQLYNQVAAILFRHDLVGIGFETNTDEYEPEAGTILPRLHEARSRDDVEEIIYQEFLRWFGDETTVGPRAYFQPVAQEIWLAWQQAGISNNN